MHILEVIGAPLDTAADSLYTADGKGVSKVPTDCNQLPLLRLMTLFWAFRGLISLQGHKRVPPRHHTPHSNTICTLQTYRGKNTSLRLQTSFKNSFTAYAVNLVVSKYHTLLKYNVSVKLGLSLQGKNTDWWRLRSNWKEYLTSWGMK